MAPMNKPMGWVIPPKPPRKMDTEIEDEKTDHEQKTKKKEKKKKKGG